VKAAGLLPADATYDRGRFVDERYHDGARAPHP
jgi:hypothetical protein